MERQIIGHNDRGDRDLKDEDHFVTCNLRTGTEVSGKVVLAILINTPSAIYLPHVLLSVPGMCAICLWVWRYRQRKLDEVGPSSRARA